MLTNQLIGAGHNAATHTARPAPPDIVAPQATTATPGAPRVDDAYTTRPVQPTEDANKADKVEDERTKLDHAEWLEQTLAVLDKIPDAVPESIYEAKAVREEQ